MTNLIPRTIGAILVPSLVAAALCAVGPAAARPLVSVDDWIGLWRGSYVCHQGVTGIYLTVQRASDDDVTAVFKFFAVPENPGVPDGEYDMTGWPGPQDNHLQLYSHKWIKAPPGYVMVGLDGDYDEATGEYSGRVRGPGCTRFILRRDVVG
jgi:hypothetical protein